MIDRLKSGAIDLLARLLVLLMFRFEVTTHPVGDSGHCVSLTVTAHRRRFAFWRKSAQA